MDDLADATLYAMSIVAHPECPHETLTTGIPSPNEQVYQCVDCGKKIVISNLTLFDGNLKPQEVLAGIIGLAFGERWSEKARKGYL